MQRVTIDIPINPAGYEQFMRCKRLPRYSVVGNQVITDEQSYAHVFGASDETSLKANAQWLFDFQRDTANRGLSLKRFCAFLDCVAGETIINSVDGDIPIVEYRGSNVLAQCGQAEASNPWMNGYGDLYKVKTSSGREIIASLSHRLLTSFGWKPISSLSCGDMLLLSDASHLRSSLASYQSTHGADDLNFWQTTLNSPTHCWLYSCLCDAQPHLVPDIDQGVAPLPSDAHAHSPYREHTDGRELKRRHIRHDQCSGHRSMMDYRYAGEIYYAADVESQVAALSPIHPSSFFQLPSRYQESAFHSKQASGFCQWSLDQKSKVVPYSYWDIITAISFVRKDYFYDIHVPNGNHYLANGFWSHNCGHGKTAIELAWAEKVSSLGRVMIQCPLAVYKQYLKEAVKFLGHPIQDLRAGEEWRDIGIMNFESMRQFNMIGCAGFVLDESSILKNASGETKDYLCNLVKNVDYRLAGSATPAPNYHEEYATQAVFLGLYKSENEFYAKYFRKDGNKWVLRAHARDAFYRDLASWATYIQKPSLLGYEHTTELPEEPEYIWHYCDTDQRLRIPSGKLIASSENFRDLSFIYGAVRSQHSSPRMDAIVEYATDKRCIIWAHRDSEESAIASAVSGCCVINGSTPIEKRVEYVEAYRAGQIQHIVSKPSVLGFGVNIPECPDMIFSGFTYSMEQFYQAVRRGHRYGRQGRLRVFVPYTDAETPILNDLQGKLSRFQRDAEELQSRFFGALPNWP